MLRRILLVCASVGCFILGSHVATAQEVVHALTGTVSQIDPAGKAITLFLDNGSKSVFSEMTDSKTQISFDKKIRADTTAADAFKSNGAYVIVFYFGRYDSPTAVAFRSLGSGPFTSTIGTVDGFDGHTHTITVKDKEGTVHTYKIGSDTVAEGGSGVVDGLKFQAQKGDQVRVVGSTASGSPTALFVRAM